MGDSGVLPGAAAGQASAMSFRGHGEGRGVQVGEVFIQNLPGQASV